MLSVTIENFRFPLSAFRFWKFVRPFQFVFQIVQIVVGEDAEFRAGKSGGVHDAGVNQLVEDDDVVLAEQRGDGAEGGGVAGGKSQRGFGVLEGGECFFQFVKRRERAANQPRRARAGAEFFHGLDGGFLQAPDDWRGRDNRWRKN